MYDMYNEIIQDHNRAEDDGSQQTDDPDDLIDLEDFDHGFETSEDEELAELEDFGVSFSDDQSWLMRTTT